ncbi:MAG: hypothetical protein J5842_07225 [Lachnospiraceae bacterium]|nr:hypothetical protein [Lachnospiraceae bacterium]
MADTIKFLKLCKYSFRYKTNIVFLILFLAIGIMNEVIAHGTQYLGGFYIVLCSIYMFQFIMSLSMSDMIQSSGIGRRIQLDIPVRLNVMMSVLLYTLLVIYRICMAKIHPENEPQIASSLLMINIMFFILFIYTGFVYKYFLISILVFCFTAVFVMTGSNILLSLPGFMVSLKAAVFIGYVGIVIGAAVQYIICRALVKIPISQRAFRGIFKEAK